MDLTIPARDDDRGIMALLDRAEQAAQAVAARDGWKLAEARSVEASSAEMQRGPTFCGFPCSPSLNALGFPAFVIAGDRMAKRHEKQGDTWYSYRAGDGYEQVLNFRAGDAAPPVVGLDVA